MSKETTTNSATILHSRYNHLLKPLRSLDQAAESLCDKSLLSASEKWQVEAVGTEEGKRNLLCGFLTGKGVSLLVQISEALTVEDRRQYGNSGSSSDANSSSCTSSTETSANSGGSEDYEGGWERGRGKEEEGGETVSCGQRGMEYVRGNEPSVYESPASANKQRVVSGDVTAKESYQERPAAAPSQLGVPLDGKRMKTDVPDPPVERLPARTAESAFVESHKGMEDAFVVLFFTFITQQLHCLWNSRNKPRSPAHSPAHHRASADAEHSEKLSLFPWLAVDVPSDEARDFFPADTVKSVTPSPSNPVRLKLSVILEAFQQFLHSFVSLKREKQSLQRKAKMYDELSRKFRALELKMTQMQQAALHSNPPPPRHGIAPPPQVSGQPQSPGNAAAMLERIAQLEEQVRQVGPLHQAYVRSEERCEQLVEVTQQWALECEDKVKVIELIEKEAEQAKVTVQQLDARVEKYKKYWMETKDIPRGGRVSGGRFEELRTELAMRRELYDQVLAQRDEATQKVQVLLSEIESLKDHNVQLIDRAANFKVQAQAKEPSVREMSIVLEQKGRLEHDLETMRKQKAELSDKIVALEILVEDLTSKVTHLEGAPLKQPRSKRSEDMVIGYNAPHPQHTSTSAAHVRAPQGSQFLIPSANSSHHHRHGYPGSTATDDSDVLSLESSDAGSGSFSSHDSTSERKEPSQKAGCGGGHSNPCSPRRATPQLKSRDTLSNPELRSRGVPCDIAPQWHDVAPQLQEMTPLPPASEEDYTSKIRYPNNSRVLVRPLLDEDISLKEGGTGGLKPQETPGIGGASKEPFYCDRSHFHYERQAPPPNQPTAVLPPTSPFLAVAVTERKCPVCQHTFLTLSETEFQTHVAVCFK